jgi:hypothetical protein
MPVLATGATDDCGSGKLKEQLITVNLVVGATDDCGSGRRAINYCEFGGGSDR